MHDVIEAILDRWSSHLLKFNKDLSRKSCRRMFRTVEGVSTDLNSFARGRLVNKLEVSEELRKTEVGSNFEFLTMLAKVNESHMPLLEEKVTTGGRRAERYLASRCCAEPVINRMDQSCTSFLCVLGTPYMRSHWEPVDRMSLYKFVGSKSCLCQLQQAALYPGFNLWCVVIFAWWVECQKFGFVFKNGVHFCDVVGFVQNSHVRLFVWFGN